MARDRQRAKQRKARRAQNPGPAPSRPHRENVPGELDHASGEVDRFEAELIRGADGEPAADPDEVEREALAEEIVEDEVVEDEVVEDELDEEPLEDDDDAEPATAGRAATVSREGAVPGQPTKRGASRFLAFIRASWAELQRVQWPDRRQVAQATAVVLGFVVIAGAYLGLADAVAQEIVDIII